MRLKNNSPRDYNHEKIFLRAGEEMEIKDESICKVLLRQDGVEEVIDKDEVQKLKEEVKKLKSENKKTSKSKK